MSRRRRAGDSSLELLLDTICNTFGGVLFLAILVSLLLKTTRDEVSPASLENEPPRPALSKADVIRRATESRELKGQIERLEEELGLVREVVKEFAVPGFDESLAKLHAEQKKQRELESRRAGLLAEISADQTAAATAGARTAAVRGQRSSAKSISEESAARLAAAQREHQELLRTAVVLEGKIKEKGVVYSAGKAPRERDTDKREFGLLIRYGRVYLTHVYSGYSRTVNLKDFTIVEGIAENNAKAKPGGGIDVTAANADDNLGVMLSGFSPDDWYPAVVVFPDSFDTFQVLKAKLVAKGYEYRLIATDEPVADRGESDGKVQ